LTRQLFYEDVKVGTEILPLVKHPTTRQLVMWAGASEDFYEVHYDKDFSQTAGFPGVIVHGRLKAAFLGQLMTDWIGDEGTLKKLTVSYRGLDFPGEDIICRGKAIRKYKQDEECFVKCKIWTENPKGRKTTTGSATVSLPSRGKP